MNITSSPMPFYDQELVVSFFFFLSRSVFSVCVQEKVYAYVRCMTRMCTVKPVMTEKVEGTMCSKMSINLNSSAWVILYHIMPAVNNRPLRILVKQIHI